MIKQGRTSGTKRQPRWQRMANQARRCAWLVLILPGCATEPGQAVAKFWDRAWGPATEGRPAPPRANAAYPNLGTIPPRPETPDMATREALAAALVREREASRTALQAPPASTPRGAPPSPSLAPAITGLAIPALTPPAPDAAAAQPQAPPAPMAAPEAAGIPEPPRITPSGIPAPPVLAPAGVPPPPVLRDPPRRP